MVSDPEQLRQPECARPVRQRRGRYRPAIENRDLRYRAYLHPGYREDVGIQLWSLHPQRHLSVLSQRESAGGSWAANLQNQTIAQYRTLTNAGVHSDLSYSKGRQSIKGGVLYNTFLRERDSLGIVAPTFNSPCVNAAEGRWTDSPALRNAPPRDTSRTPRSTRSCCHMT